MRTIRNLLAIFLLAPLPVFAQTVHIPDPNLRAAVSEALDGVPVTRETMLQLTELDARERGVTDLTGLGHAHNLRSLMLVYNNISDLTPISDLRLDDLWLWGNLVANLSPLANMTTLTHLDLGYNRISDISPLEKLTRLKWLELQGNQITDVTPLAALTSLEKLWITDNTITDHSSLDGLSLEVFEYDQICDMPPIPLGTRLENRGFPSIGSAWGDVSFNQPHLTYLERMSQYDMVFNPPSIFYQRLVKTEEGWSVTGSMTHAVGRRDDYLAHSPNMIFLGTMEALWKGLEQFPEDSPLWLRDAEGNIELAFDGDVGLIDLNNPAAQKWIVERAVAMDRCGLYDGIVLDGWNERYIGRRNHLDAAALILKEIRERVRPNFLIGVNSHHSILPATGAYINGFFTEPPLLTDGDVSETFRVLEETFVWGDSHLRKPHVWLLEIQGIDTDPPDGKVNNRWMRLTTTLGLTFTDGYVLYNLPAPGVYGHYWYDFWDADLGRPLGKKSQLYEGRPGLYIREYTNGWAVYNHSGEAQVITLPAEVRSVTSGLSNTKHAVLNLDGDILLNIPPLLPGDINGDDIVNILDLTLVAQGFGTGDLTADVNGDGVVNFFDLVFVAGQF